MSRYSKMCRVARCGAPDSKYFGNLDQFEKDLEEKAKQGEILQNKVTGTLRDLIFSDPLKAENTYHLVIQELIKIKEEYSF